jgi:hypothetical protein
MAFQVTPRFFVWLLDSTRCEYLADKDKIIVLFSVNYSEKYLEF